MKIFLNKYNTQVTEFNKTLQESNNNEQVTFQPLSDTGNRTAKSVINQRGSNGFYYLNEKGEKISDKEFTNVKEVHSLGGNNLYESIVALATLENGEKVHVFPKNSRAKGPDYKTLQHIFCTIRKMYWR